MSTLRFTVSVDVEGDTSPRVGTEAHENLRMALWDAVDEMGDVWTTDAKDRERSFTVSVTGVAIDPVRK